MNLHRELEYTLLRYSMSNNYTLNEEQLTPSRLYTERAKLFERRQYSSQIIARAHILNHHTRLSLSLSLSCACVHAQHTHTLTHTGTHSRFTVPSIALSQLLPLFDTRPRFACICIALIRLTRYTHCCNRMETVHKPIQTHRPTDRHTEREGRRV